MDNEAMYNSAEEAVIESHGQEQELNTQRCLELQRELLSSSPLHVTQDNHNVQDELYPQLEFGFEAEDEPEEKKHSSSKLSFSRDIETQPSESTSNISIDFNAIKEREIKELQLSVKRSTTSSIWNSPKNMEDFTQKSSMSLTQEIPITAYSHLFSKKLREKPYFISVESEESHGNSREFSNLESKNATDKEIHSAVLACQINNACYMKLEPEIREKKDDDSESLDTPRAVDQLRYSYRNLQRYEPQTPHISANPFQKRGSIMQKVDLFVATQPSSASQYHASPTSSRPSPETYGDYSSPIKRQKIKDSPLDDVTNRRTVAQPPTHPVTHNFSKDQQLIRTPVSGVQSFDIKLKSLASISGHEFSSFTPMKENQEKKSRKLPLPASEDSDSSQETLSMHLRGHMVYKQFSKEPLQNSQANSKSSLQNSSKNEIISIEDRQINQENSKFESKTIDIHGVEKQDSSLPSQPSLIGETFTQDSITANFSGGTNIISKISCNKTILAQEIENQDLVPQICSDEPQLPKLNENPNQNSVVIEKSSQTSAPKDAPKNKSSQVLMKKNHFYSDLMETIPETSPLTHQTFSVDELSNVPFEENRNSNTNTNETTVFAKDLDSEAEIRTRSPLAHEQKVVTKTVSPLARTPTVSKCKLRLNSPKPMESKVDTTVINSGLEVKKIRLADKNSKTHDHLLYPSINTLVSTSHKNNNHQSDSSRKNRVLEENSNNYKNIDSKNLTSEPQKVTNGNTKSNNIDDESESESLLITESRMASKTLEIQGNSTFSHASISTLESRSRVNNNITSSLSTPATICEDFTSSLHHVNNSKRKSTNRKSKISSTKTLVSSASNKRNVRRKSVGATVALTAPSTRSSKRQSLAHTTEEDSEDPLSARMTPALQASPSSGLFKNMVFTVSFVKNDKERNNVMQLITENGGLLLDHGFDPLFEPISQSDPANHDCGTLSLSALGKSLSFAGVIADEHSRKTKYVQALALGLPCLSGRWIQNCVSKNTILDWSPYLLCAGQSLVLGNACRSRTLQSYIATDAEFSSTFATRKKIFEGKSVLLVMGKGKTQQKRKTFNFLTRALGPTRIGHVTDITEAQKILSEDEAKGLHNWDILHVHDNDKNRGLNSLGVGRKRKFTDCDGPSRPNLKRVRIITDEIMIQSLIFGELIEE